MSTTVKERPILMSAPMVQAVLAGRKTQTRRMVKPQPVHRAIKGNDDIWYDADCINPGREIKCRYGRVGERLYVRESHYRFTGCSLWEGFTQSPYGGPYKAICYEDYPRLQAAIDACAVIRIPSIHMPRWACRIVLEITNVRIERLQSITRADACDEGWPGASEVIDNDPKSQFCGLTRGQYIKAVGEGDDAVIEWYADLWESINGKGSWDANPWVWAISFKSLSPGEVRE